MRIKTFVSLFIPIIESCGTFYQRVKIVDFDTIAILPLAHQWLMVLEQASNRSSCR